MFPKSVTIRCKSYHMINNQLTQNELKALFLSSPYNVYAIVNESLEKETTMFTTFLVLYSVDFEDNVILYDVSRQIHTTVTTDLNILTKGYIEFIDVGVVDRYSIKFYMRDELE